MAKKHYHINPVTLAMEQVETSFKDIIRSITWPMLFGVLLGIGLFILFVIFFPSPREKQIQQKYDALKAQNNLLTSQVERIQEVVTDLQQRDDNLYRALLQAEPIPISARLGSTQPLSYYDSIARMTDSELAADLARKIDLLENEVYSQMKSYDELVEYARNQEIRLDNLPAIQPVLNNDLTRFASGYGWRVDPVYHTRRFHAGIDFAAPTGTDVYATGNAKVIFCGWRQGYGNCIELSHGYDYVTLYAHLHKILVRQGQQVKRGDVIALVGSTGKSTGPHLHYEVHHKGQAVDPRNFYFLDLNPEEYDRMVQLLSNAGNMLD